MLHKPSRSIFDLNTELYMRMLANKLPPIFADTYARKEQALQSHKPDPAKKRKRKAARKARAKNRR